MASYWRCVMDISMPTALQIPDRVDNLGLPFAERVLCRVFSFRPPFLSFLDIFRAWASVSMKLLNTPVGGHAILWRFTNAAV